MSIKDTLITIIPYSQIKATDFLQSIKQLLPKGPIWGFKILDTSTEITKDNINDGVYEVYKDNINDGLYEVYKDSLLELETFSNTKFGQLLSCFASELLRFRERWHDLYREFIPGLSVELLPEWEKQAGLPNECTINYELIPLEERQLYTHAQLYSDHSRGLTEEFILDYALAVDYVITIEDNEFQKPFLVAPDGVDQFDIGSRVGDRLTDQGQFGVIVIKIISGDTDPDPLARFQCQVEKLKPAHVQIIWQ